MPRCFFLFVMALLVGRAVRAGLQPPLIVPFGFSTRGMDVDDAGITSRNLNSAMHIAAMQMALKLANDDLAKIPGLQVSLGARTYQGGQISTGTGQVHNAYFDGAFGAYTMGSDVVGVLSCDDDLETTKSMSSTFGGWGVATFMMAQQDSEFSHGSTYPLKARIVPSDSFQAIALVSILKIYAWNRVAVLYSSDAVGIDLFVNFRRTLGTSTLDGDKPSGITMLFSAVLPVANTDFSGTLAQAKASGATIFVLLMGTRMQALVLRQGYSAGVFAAASQTIGAGLSTDSPDVGGLAPHEHLAAAGVSASDAAAMMRGHMLMSFEPRVHFLTPKGQWFLRNFKNLAPTRNVDGVAVPSAVVAAGSTTVTTSARGFRVGAQISGNCTATAGGAVTG